MFVTRHIKLYIALTAIIFATTALILGVFGFNLGIDFTGGSLTEVSYIERPEKAVLEASLTELGTEFNFGGFSLRETSPQGERSGYILRSRNLSEAERIAVEEMMLGMGTEAVLERFTSIGPVIGEELKDKAVWAIGGVALMIVLYVAFAFRGLKKPVGSWVYGGITIFALLHDVLVPAALMSILGYLVGAEIDVLFVMAMLAVLGYSVNDTIVVFDRVRENLIKYRQEKKIKKDGEESIEYIYVKPFETIVGESVEETLLRSINTSLTTLLALIALYFLAGEVTKNFALVLMAGVIAGAYSSIFIANPLLITYVRWREGKEKTA